MQLEAFFSDVSAELMRGTSQDAKIPRWTRDAASWLETNIDFQYMRQVVEIEVDPEADTPEVIDLPNTRVKSFEFLRLYTEGLDRSRVYGDPLVRQGQALTGRGVGKTPTSWWVDGVDSIVLDVIPQEAIKLQLAYYEYTDWPTDGTAQPTLLQRYNTLLFRQTMIHAAVGLKDNRMAAEWKGMRDEALTVVIAAEEALKYSGQRLVMGGYRGRRA